MSEEQISGDLRMGRRIKFTREKAGLTQESLAARVDRSLVMIQLLEAGKRGGSPSTITNLAEVLGVSAAYLQFGPSAFQALEVPTNLTEDDLEQLRQQADHMSMLRLAASGGRAANSSGVIVAAVEGRLDTTDRERADMSSKLTNAEKAAKVRARRSQIETEQEQEKEKETINIKAHRKQH